MSSSGLGKLVSRCLGVFRCHHVHPQTLEKRIVNVAVTGEFLGTLPSPLSGSIVLHTKTQYQQDRYVESAQSGMNPQLTEPDGLNDPRRRCQGVVLPFSDL
jgi:hypothetical protein